MRSSILALRNGRATRGQHAGLLLQRYLCENATGNDGNPEEKRALLQAAINAACNTEVRALYQAAYDRWQKSLPELTASSVLQTTRRVIVGLGSENVLETGIRLHHTYGMPILPGSALKGLTAHYCDQVWGERAAANPSSAALQFRAGRQEDRAAGRKAESPGEYHKFLFGTTDESGCVVFHDAWLTPDSSTPLKLDVMTPHHPKWLDGSEPPTDFDSPVPVPFLSVSGAFHVAVSWCGPVDDARKYQWFFDRAIECLRDALFHWGVGGKTSSGYGQFDEEKWKAAQELRQKEEAKRAAEAAQQAELARMTPLERSIKEFLEQHPNKAEQREWLKLFEELRKPDGRFRDTPDRIGVARRVKSGMQAAKVWRDQGNDGNRKKFIEVILGESS